METNSTKSEIFEISGTPIIHTLMTQMSTVTQAIEGLKNKIVTTE